MNIPKNIKIGGIRYKVIITENLHDDEGGTINTLKKTIKIYPGAEAFQHATFLHEVIHAINMELREETVEFLAQALYQIIVDNPKIFEGGVQKK